MEIFLFRAILSFSPGFGMYWKCIGNVLDVRVKGNFFLERLGYVFLYYEGGP